MRGWRRHEVTAAEKGHAMSEREMGWETDTSRVRLPYLRTWRLRKLLSQRDLATRAGAGESTIIRIEGGGRANFLTAHRLARGLGITPEDLLEPPPGSRASGGPAWPPAGPDGGPHG